MRTGASSQAVHQGERHKGPAAHVEDADVCIDASDHARAGQGQGAAAAQARRALAGQGFHHDPDVARAHGQVHGPAHGRHGIVRAQRPVGQVALAGDLKRTQHRDVDVAAAHDGKGIDMIEDGRAFGEGDRLLAGVDEIAVGGLVVLQQAHAEDAVLAVQLHAARGVEAVGDHGGHAYAQVDHGAGGQVGGHQGGQLLA
jgi:hypothetical protein